uniref:DNA primase AEP n=1 Tax=Oncorhynchus tshawytscha TaxID=74940 RepID=A0A8C8GN68_ONCTS
IPEFSFMLKDDIYVRYQSFSTQSKLEKAMQKMNPYKIDIGAPNQHNTVKTGSFQALEKELVFDIDMTDYNDVRSCCTHLPKVLDSDYALCILDRALRGDHECIHLFYVWVIQLSPYALVGQDILGSKEAADKVPEDILFLCRFFLLHDTKRWYILKTLVQNKRTTAKVHYFEKEIMWQYCYPRVDVNVSKGVNNHLLKSPFSVHPKTGRISVPIDLRELDRFDPCDVPTISWIGPRQQEEEKEEPKENERETTNEQAWKYVKLLDQFLEGMARSRKGEHLKKSDLQKDF